MGELILLILIVIIIIMCAIYLYFNKINDALYSKPVNVEESICVVKNGHINGKKRVTYRCDDPNGCMYKGKLHRGIFYSVEECVDDRKTKGWIYSLCGPFYGSGDITCDNQDKISDMILLEESQQRVCFSLETGHPKFFNDGIAGFTGILAKCRGKCKVPEIKISTKYENSKITLNKIKTLLDNDETDVFLIDGVPFVLQPCSLRGNSWFNYFQLISNDNHIIIYNNQIFSSEYNDTKYNVYFSLENTKTVDNKIYGVLTCYKNMHVKGWIDKNFKWHSGFSKMGALPVMLNNNKIYDINGKSFSVPSENNNITSDMFDVNMILNFQDFIENRGEKFLA